MKILQFANRYQFKKYKRKQLVRLYKSRYFNLLNLQNKMMKNQSYEFVKGYENQHIKIGFGSYGQVKLARNAETKELVAIKLIYAKNAKEEIAVHSKLDHPNIIKLINYFHEKEKNITYIVLQYADGGTLFEKIKTSNMSKETIRKIFKQSCQAVDYIHKNNFMHRDIKPENILLTKNNDVKFCDFGFAAYVGQRKTLCGTYEYMAPQMIQNMSYDYKVDIWALGILFFELIEGVAPFRGETADEVLKQMKKNIYFSEKFQQEQIHLIKSILRVNPSNRPTIQHILEHPYFKKGSKSEQVSFTTAPSQQQIKISNSIFAPKIQIKYQQKKPELKFDTKFYKLVPNPNNVKFLHNNPTIIHPYNSLNVPTKSNSHILSPQYSSQNRTILSSFNASKECPPIFWKKN